MDSTVKAVTLKSEELKKKKELQVAASPTSAPDLTLPTFTEPHLE